MRKLFLILLCLTAVGCSKDDDGNVAMLIGKWEVVLEENLVGGTWKEKEYEQGELVIELRSDETLTAWEFGEQISEGDYLYDAKSKHITLTVMTQETLSVEAVTKTRLIMSSNEVRIVLKRL